MQGNSMKMGVNSCALQSHLAHDENTIKKENHRLGGFLRTHLCLLLN